MGCANSWNQEEGVIFQAWVREISKKGKILYVHLFVPYVWFRLKRGCFLFVQNSRMGGIFQTWVRAWYTHWLGVWLGVKPWLEPVLALYLDVHMSDVVYVQIKTSYRYVLQNDNKTATWYSLPSTPIRYTLIPLCNCWTTKLYKFCIAVCQQFKWVKSSSSPLHVTACSSTSVS